MHTPRTVLAALLLLPLLAACGSERVTIANDEPAPAFELERLDGGTITLDELQGQVVALRFWADWCPFCRHEMRELESVYPQLREQGLEILAVNVGQDRSRVERFVDRVHSSYPTLLDPDSEIARRYGVIAIPVTFFIDREGIVRGRILGESDNATFERMAAPLLKLGASSLGPDPASVGGTGWPSAGRREYFPVGLTAASLRPTPADDHPIPPLAGEGEQPAAQLALTTTPAPSTPKANPITGSPPALRGGCRGVRFRTVGGHGWPTSSAHGWLERVRNRIPRHPPGPRAQRTRTVQADAA